MNVASLLADAAKQRPDHPALVHEGQTFTYAELDRASARVAASLAELGISAGKVVAIYLESCPELVLSYLAAMRLGAVPNVVNGFLRAAEVKVVVADSRARLLVTDPGRHDALLPYSTDLGVKRTLVTGWNQPVGQDLPFDQLLEGDEAGGQVQDVDPTALANLLYTSGTTGSPKGVMLTHENILDNARNFSTIQYTPDTKLLIAAPLFHCWGLISGVLGCMSVGATAITVPRFQAEAVLDLIERHRPTAMMGVPTMYNFMAKSPTIDQRDLSSLEFVMSAAAPMPLELLETIQNRWKVGYSESYGLTETSPVITTTHHSSMRPGSGGRAMGDTRLKVVGPLNHDLPQGRTGELWARGTAIAAGYFRKPEATAEVFTDDGWFRTGDIAKIDDDGYVYIVDRLKDMINVAGEKVYPRDVEELLHRHPAVADAVVIGIPDADRGEVVKAFVVRRPDVPCTCEELIESLKGELASFKVPREIEFTEEIPRSPSGKALRRLLR